MKYIYVHPNFHNSCFPGKRRITRKRVNRGILPLKCWLPLWWF